VGNGKQGRRSVMGRRDGQGQRDGQGGNRSTCLCFSINLNNTLKNTTRRRCKHFSCEQSIVVNAWKDTGAQVGGRRSGQELCVFFKGTGRINRTADQSLLMILGNYLSSSLTDLGVLSASAIMGTTASV